MTCTCGNSEDHVVARRVTSDGKSVQLWADGMITGSMGYAIRGIGRARSARGQADYMAASWMVMDEVCAYDKSELAPLFRAALATVKVGGNPGDMRRRFAAKSS